ncbi:MAG: phosphotransferase [Gammaproteobacteria bacterium AqS3]|nr:phosphotransferase [Gammaproteobacteria bacterium AqS3]
MFSGTGKVRAGQEIDVQRLEQYLHAELPGFAGPLTIEQFNGGQSNPTYLLITPDKKYVLRRKPPGKLLPSAHAVDREYKVISALHGHVPVAKSYLLCEDDSVAGTMFYVMDFLDGRIIWDGIAPDAEPAERKALYRALLGGMIALHKVDYEAVGLADYGKPGNYVLRQISRWSKQYLASVTEQIDAMDTLIKWLPENIPEEGRTCVVHGDYRLDNTVMHAERTELLGILDWELGTLGNPLADFSYHCMQWYANPALRDEKSCRELGMPTIDEYREWYCEGMGIAPIEDWYFYIAFNNFKLACILQGIIGRVRDGTATSVHAERRAAEVRPLAERALHFAQKLM